MDRKTLLSSVGVLVLFVVAAALGVLLPERAEPLAAERVSVLCATESGNCVESWNGSDIVTYSDAGSTETARIDGATGNITVGSEYALLFDTASTTVVAGTGTITGTASYAHGLTTVEFAICAMNQVADDDAGDAARCVATYGSTTVTVTLYQDDWVTQATETDIPISYFAVGQ